MRPSHISYLFLGSFLAAVFALQWWQASAYPWQVWLAVGVLGLFGAVGIFIADRRPSLMLFAIMIGTAAAFWTVSRTTHVPSPVTVDTHAKGTEVALRGFIADDPDSRALQTNYIVETHAIKTGMGAKRVNGNVLLIVSVGNPAWEYGDDVIVRGVLEQPESEDDFRYDRHLSLKSVYSLIRDPVIERAGENRGNRILRMIYRFKNAIRQRINLMLTEPHASLLAGLLLGSRGSMPQDLVRDFKATGLTHIIAISGYNITILITAMGTLLFWLPLKWRFWPSVILIAVFTILTGASASAVRAAIMGILGLLALQLNRIQTMRLTVLWSAFLMLAWNPKQLWYDAGFQLSFLALIGVLEISPLLKPYLHRVPKFLNIQESLCLTLSAQLLAAPWILFLFGQLSLVAPISNLLGPPAVPYAMLFGTASLLIGWIWIPIGRMVAAIAWLPLQWITGVAHILGSLPFASLDLPGLHAIWIAAYYSLLTSWIVRNNSASRLVAPAVDANKQLTQSAPLGRFTTHISESSSFRSNAAAQRFQSAVGAGN